MISRWLLLAALVAACGSSKSTGSGASASGSSSADEPCAKTFQHLRDPAFGRTVGGSEAIAFGIACSELSADDLACLDRAKAMEDAKKCDHAVVAMRNAITAWGTQCAGSSCDDAPSAVADALCACHDLACVVSFGRASAETLVRPMEVGPNRKRVDDCLAKLDAAKP